MIDLINSPPELIITKLLDGAPFRSNQIHERDRWLIEHAYSAGADQELEACCEWVEREIGHGRRWNVQLRAARRPKPPSLKEQAQRILVENGTTLDGRMELDSDDIAIIHRALEALPND